MTNEISDLKKMWQSGKQHIPESNSKASDIINLAKEKKRKIGRIQTGNIAIMGITVIVLLLFFIKVAQFKQALSIVGCVLMVGGLLIRIIVELAGIFKGKRIDISNTVSENQNSSIKYYKYRNQVHRPVTITIFTLYSIGFYMLTPEFSLYFSKTMLLLIDLSYLPIAFFIILSIRSAIKKEKKELKELMLLQKQFLDK